MAASEHSTDWKMVLIGEALALKLLARLLLDEPDKDWLQALIADDIFGDIPFGAEQGHTRLGQEFLQKWLAEIQTVPPDQWFEKIRIDHTRLFIGAGSVLAAPWESVYLSREHMLFQEQTLEVRAWYRRYGIEAEKLYKEPDDHISLELSFLAHLATLALQALEAGDESTFKDLLRAQRDFLTGHLLRWAPAWAELVEEHAHTDFYRGLAKLTMGALLAAAETLEIKVPKQK